MYLIYHIFLYDKSTRTAVKIEVQYSEMSTLEIDSSHFVKQTLCWIGVDMVNGLWGNKLCDSEEGGKSQ